VHVGFNNEAHHNVEEEDVVDEEKSDKEKLPPKEPLISEQSIDLDAPTLSRHQLINESY